MAYLIELVTLNRRLLNLRRKGYRFSFQIKEKTETALSSIILIIEI